MVIRISKDWKFAPILLLNWGQDPNGILSQFPFFSKDAADFLGRETEGKITEYCGAPTACLQPRQGRNLKVEHHNVSPPNTMLTLTAGCISTRNMNLSNPQ